MAEQKSSGDPVSYIHAPLEESIAAIGGNYRIMEEKRVSFQGRDFFYLIGFACLDTTCCGSGGFGYALVKGFVREWKNRVNAAGHRISTFDPISDPEQQAAITEMIRAAEIVRQIEFA